MAKPTCPKCKYDLTGLIERETTVDCPECSTHSNYAQATFKKPPPSTIKHALIWLLAIPSALAAFSWGMLYLGDRLQGAELAFFIFLLLNLYLPILSITLLIQDWRARRRLSPFYFRYPLGMIALFIFLSFCVSEFINWIGFLDWVDAVASV